MRLQALRARRLPKDEGDRQVANVPANLLDRQFAAERPNQKWIADFTYLWTAEGWLYVTAVIDLFSRRVVGWSMSAAMTAQLVTDALLMAVWRRGNPSAPHAKSIVPGTRPERTCSTTSSGSTIRPGVIRRSDMSALLSSSGSWD
jgi:transposase InsO family protein